MPVTGNIASEGDAVAMSTPPVVHETGRDALPDEIRPPLLHVLLEQN